jgi:protoheme IX farnesyltransferase
MHSIGWHNQCCALKIGKQYMNNRTSTQSNYWRLSLRQALRDFSLLVKFRLSMLAVFSAFMAYVLASSSYRWNDLAILAIGGFLVTGAASILNQVLEKDYDKLMHRTANRPLASGRMEVSNAVLLAGFFSVFGLIALAYFNTLTAVLGALALVSYAFIYTPMKRVSPIAVWIGAVPGALPMVIGWVAAMGEIQAPAIFLFSVQFLWQFPHFWAIAWLAHEDYSRAGFHLLPTKELDGRNKQTALQAALYALFLVPMSILPLWLKMTGYFAVVALFLVSLLYLGYACKLYLRCDRKSALQLMFSSFLYLPIMLLALWLDKL